VISQLTIHNFKCFVEQTLVFAPLTLLVGANAAGKSSTIQSLLLLRQSHLPGALNEGKLLLNGRLVNLGTIEDAFNRDTDGDELNLALRTADGTDYIFQFPYRKGETDSYTMIGAPLRYEAAALNLFLSDFNYLNAERIGPRLLYPRSEDERTPYDVGVRGEYAAHVLGRFANQPIRNDALAYRNPETGEADSRLLGNQTRYWMREIIPNFEFEATPLLQADQVQILFGNRGPNDLFRPTNIGFGLIYTLPIIVAALVAPAGSLLIVENPEAHLHPASQSAIGRFLARVAAAGVQVVVETHSDHVLNGIRVATNKGAWGTSLPAEQVSIQYFIAGNREQPQRVIEPRLYPGGGITPWPEGFFDQFDKDLMDLL
jgi:predicted ATPase